MDSLEKLRNLQKNGKKILKRERRNKHEVFYLRRNYGTRTDNFFSQLKNCILIVKNVPCSKCRQCGEEYFDGDTIDRLEDLMQTAENLASELLIIEYNTTAAA